MLRKHWEAALSRRATLYHPNLPCYIGTHYSQENRTHPKDHTALRQRSCSPDALQMEQPVLLLLLLLLLWLLLLFICLFEYPELGGQVPGTTAPHTSFSGR